MRSSRISGLYNELPKYKDYNIKVWVECMDYRKTVSNIFFNSYVLSRKRDIDILSYIYISYSEVTNYEHLKPIQIFRNV